VIDAKPNPWQLARIVSIRDETPNAKTFRFALPEPTNHRAGQHMVLRLTAPDGYTASRSYSIASPPDDTTEIELTVERFVDGEVSPFLHDVAVVGDEIELRGPIGGWFVWDADTPAVLIGGGSGMVPLMAMLRLARARDRTGLVHLVASVRTPTDLYYADELQGPETTIVYTRDTPPDHARQAARLSTDDLAPFVASVEIAYVCGSPPFADAASRLLLELGLSANQIRVERFGATG
jgi:ferredoxin-NADP reductase